MTSAQPKSVANTSSDESRARLLAVLETAVDAIITTDETGTIESFNPAAEKMFGYPAADVIGQNVSLLMPVEHATDHKKYMLEYGESGRHRVVGRTREINALHADGTRFPIELALSGADMSGRRLYTGIIRDISDRRRAEAELDRHRRELEGRVMERTAALRAANERLEQAQAELQRANTQLRQLIRVDKLTNIGNRRAFDERFDLEWRRCQRATGSLALLMCDIDHFKQFNDHYGHRAGDECLRRIAAVLDRCFQRAAEFVARYGGEEFAAVLSGVDSQTAMERAEAVRREVEALAIEHARAAKNRFVTVSIGVASTEPTQKTRKEALLDAADAALYQAKENGRNRVEATAI